MNSLSQAFPGCQQGPDGPTETTGFYKLRKTESRPESTGSPSPFLTSFAGISESSESDYLDLISQESLLPKKTDAENDLENDIPESLNWPKPARQVRCGSWALVRSCSDGHVFAKTLDCGREWCEKCRSSAHSRRLGRWLSKAQKIKEMGYLTVTLPLDKRPRSQKELRRLGLSITRILKRRGFFRGLRRDHFFGDKSRVWNPHFNFLLDSGYLNPELIESIKKAISGILKAEKIVLHYQFTQEVRLMLHWLKYITRPTFLKESWDPEMVEEFFNFRNAGSWGKWDDENKWALPEEEKKLANYKKVGAGICPTCGKKLEGGRVVLVEDFSEDLDWEQIWANVWQYKGPPENALLFRFFKIFADAKK